MSRKVVTLIIFISTLNISACGQLDAWLRPTTPQQVDVWVEQHQYDRALNALSRQHRSRPTPELEQQLLKIRAQAIEYDLSQATEARAKLKQGKWEDALAQINRGLKNFSKGPELQKLRGEVRERQERDFSRLEVQLLLGKADWLLHKQSIQKQMHAVDPFDTQLQQDREDTAVEIDQVGDRLARLGAKALARQELDSAEACLTVAKRLRPTPDINIAMAELEHLKKRQQDAQRQQRVAVQKERREERSRNLIAAAQKAMTVPDLPAARDKIAALRKNDPKHPQLPVLEKRLNQEIQVRVNALLERGNNFYTNGEIQKARDTWSLALKLDPANEDVKGQITRAERVLDKLKELRGDSTIQQ